MLPETDTEVVVIGLGVAGASVAFQLAERNIPAIAVEARSRGHLFGSSHGYSRVSRTAVGEGVDYLPLVRRSAEVWSQLESRGYDLFRRTGLLYLARTGAGATRHGDLDFLKATRTVASAAEVDLIHLNSTDLQGRYPQFIVGAGTYGYLEPGAGVLRPEACVDALCTEAEVRGVALRYEEPVVDISRQGGKVVVDTAAGRYRASKVVVAAGSWTPGLVGGSFSQNLRVYRQVQYWFSTDRPDLWDQSNSPAFLWFHGTSAEDMFYGFPIIDGGKRAVKVATEQYEESCDPDAFRHSVEAHEVARMYEKHVRGRLAGVSSHCVEAMACSYTHNIDQDRNGRFLIGQHHALDGVWVISACSGHGFKHAAGIGDAVVRRLVGEPPFCDLAAFAS